MCEHSPQADADTHAAGASSRSILNPCAPRRDRATEAACSAERTGETAFSLEHARWDN